MFENKKMLSTDVLVVGGGIAGVFAAVYAKAEGADVVLVDKGKVGFSGLTPWFHGYAVYDESKGITKEEWHAKYLTATDYITNTDYVDLFIEYSKQTWDDLVAWGATDNAEHGGQGPMLRKKAIESGATLVERTMLIDLLKENDQVIGAIGFEMESGTPVVIYAKSTILCTGSGTFKTPGWPASPNTFDGHMMAYRAGATLAGKELNDFHGTNTVYPSYTAGNSRITNNLHPQYAPLGHSMNHNYWCAREGIHTNVTYQDLLDRAKARGKRKGGDGPPPKPDVEGPPNPGDVIGAAGGASEHRCDGVLPVDNTCFSGIDGLYAAGDAMCTGGVGLAGSAAPGCAVQGLVSGKVTAQRAKTTALVTLPEEKLQQELEQLFSYLRDGIGYSGDYVVQLVQSITIPYYVLYVKEESRLSAALTNIQYLKTHFLPRLVAHDVHELRNVYEAINIVTNAEMKLRASLYRTESRASHYREDCPARDDANWLAWVTIKETQDGMTLGKQPIPQRAMPDASLSYGARYENRYPGELEYLAQKQIAL